jgi:hypothetical protein
MTKLPETTSNEFDPNRMQEIVRRLQAEGRMPSPEQLSAVLQKHRPGTGGKSSRPGGRSNSGGHPMLLAKRRGTLD